MSKDPSVPSSNDVASFYDTPGPDYMIGPGGEIWRFTWSWEDKIKPRNERERPGKGGGPGYWGGNRTPPCGTGVPPKNWTRTRI